MHSQTFFWTFELNKTKDRKVWTPHISLFRSFSKIDTAVHSPGWWLDECFSAFLWSFELTIDLSSRTRVGHFLSSSLMQSLQDKSFTSSTGTLRKSEGVTSLRLQTTLHSSPIWAITFRRSSSLRPAWANIALAIDGIWPPARFLPILVRLWSMVVLKGWGRPGEVTVIYCYLKKVFWYFFSNTYNTYMYHNFKEQSNLHWMRYSSLTCVLCTPGNTVFPHVHVHVYIDRCTHKHTHANTHTHKNWHSVFRTNLTRWGTYTHSHTPVGTTCWHDLFRTNGRLREVCTCGTSGPSQLSASAEGFKRFLICIQSVYYLYS